MNVPEWLFQEFFNYLSYVTQPNISTGEQQRANDHWQASLLKAGITEVEFDAAFETKIPPLIPGGLRRRG